MLCWAFGDFCIQHSTRKVGNIEIMAIIGIVGSIGLLPFVIFDFKLLSSVQNIVLVSVLGVITFVMSVVDFEALKEGKLSVVEVILEIELPVRPWRPSAGRQRSYREQYPPHIPGFAVRP